MAENNRDNNEIASKISKIVGALESYKSPFWALWQWAVRFSAGDSPLRYTASTGMEVTNPSDPLDDECFDPQIKGMIGLAKDYYSGLFFPAREPWTVKPSYLDDLSIDERTAEECTTRINMFLQNPRSRWYEAREVFIDNYVRLGTGDLFGIETKDVSCPFIIRSLGVWAMSVGRDLEEEYQVYNWTAQQIVDTFGREKIHRQDVLEAYDNYDVSNNYKVYLLICRNHDYSKDATLGKKSMPYMGYWFLDDKIPLDVEYYPEKPHCINRYSIRPGKLYGYSPLCDYKKSFESLEGSFFLTMSALGKLADPRIGYYDLGSVGTLELDSDAKFVPFNAGILGSGQSPVFPIQDVGDISGLINIIRPDILNGLRQAYKLDAMADYFSQKTGNPPTATQVLTIQNIKNKMLAPQVSRFAEQLSDFRARITMIVLRSMADDKKYDMDKEVARRIKEHKDGLFEIEENAVVKRIIYSQKAEQFSSDLQIIGAAGQIQPSLAPAIDLYDSLADVLDAGLVRLRAKDEYEDLRTQAEQAQVQTGLAEARGAEAEAEMLEQETQ